MNIHIWPHQIVDRNVKVHLRWDQKKTKASTAQYNKRKPRVVNNRSTCLEWWKIQIIPVENYKPIVIIMFFVELFRTLLLALGQTVEDPVHPRVSFSASLSAKFSSFSFCSASSALTLPEIVAPKHRHTMLYIIGSLHAYWINRFRAYISYILSKSEPCDPDDHPTDPRKKEVDPLFCLSFPCYYKLH